MKRHGIIWRFLFCFPLVSVLAGQTHASLPLLRHSTPPEALSRKLPSRSPTAASAGFSQTLADNNACTVSLTGLDMDATWGFQLQLLLENKTDTERLTFMLQHAAVNGIPCDPIWACEVPAKTSLCSEMLWLPELLVDLEISHITQIQLTFQVFESEHLHVPDLLQETVVLLFE